MIVVIGAGMGGLTAAAWLAKRGRRVLVLEARAGAGGLAAGFEAGGLRFDAGPYVLLDRPGLEWVFDGLGESLSSHVTLRPVEDVYRVEREDGPAVTIHRSLEKTAAALDALGPGTGDRYARFVEGMTKVYERLRPLQYVSRPGLGHLLRTGGWRHVPFLFRSLAGILEGAGLPRPAVDALSIWTHVAGQQGLRAPSPMAFVPVLIHRFGAFVPEGGMSRIPAAMEEIARRAGAGFRYGTRVTRIRASGGRVTGVEAGGEVIEAEAVVSDAGGLRTYLELLDATPPALRERLGRLPLQTPGVSAYLAVEGIPAPPFLKFRLPRRGMCRLLITPGTVDPALAGTARLLGPVDYGESEAAGPDGQRSYLERLLAEPWWRGEFTAARPVATRTPSQWGAEFLLFRNSMNPVMTARFMRQGRLPHRSPVVRGLYLAGSSTHPGQWVSFCAISGILAAREAAC